ncbi:hypothetical protein KBB27_02920, partial [Patescibacteria group bacterium]|nr:hypothetical protein [Patescibacteria group bacterium]
SYPIALAGRVPTNVSSINGAIEPGDALAPSTIPGVAVKATKPGPIIGLALEAFAGQNVGKIEVFVNPTWWGGSSVATSVATGPTQSKNGFAEVTVGKTRVHVDLTTFTRYPHLQITPYSQMEQGWWIDEVNARGFDIVLGGVIGHNARFSWTAIETPDDTQIALSSGRTFSLDPISGQIQFPPGVGDQDPPALPREETALPTDSTETLEDTATTTESTTPSSTPESSSTTESVISEDVETTTESIEVSAAQEEVTDSVPIQETTSTTTQ